MADRFSSFDDLSAAFANGIDYEIICLADGRDTSVVIMAPHGGAIESYTAELAREVAGTAWAYYAFRGKMHRGNQKLHIASTRFDEPQALSLLTRAVLAVVLHGASGSSPFTMLGGLHDSIRECLECHLRAAGFAVKHPSSSLAGLSSMNLCNRTSTGRGVQLELSRALRLLLRSDADRRSAFTAVVRRCVEQGCFQARTSFG